MVNTNAFSFNVVTEVNKKLSVESLQSLKKVPENKQNNDFLSFRPPGP